MLLSQAFDLYIREMRIRGFSRMTEARYLVAMVSLKTFFKSDVDVSKITFESVRDYIDWLDSKRLKGNSKRAYLSPLRQVLRHCTERGYDVLNPVNVPLPKKDPPSAHFLTPDEVEKLIRVAGKIRNKALISFLYSTGMRVGECLSINRNQVKENFFTVNNAKNRGTRICFIDDRTRKYLDIYLSSRKDNDPALFYSNVKKCRMQHQNVEFMFRRWRRLSGLEGVTAHSLRHSFATDLNRNGADIYTISKLMGHSSISSTERYLHLWNKALAETYSKYHKV